MESFELYIYELDDVNLGHFSPSETKIAKDANEVLTLLSNTALSLDRAAVVTEPVGESLTPAALEAFEVERGGYRVKARSEGNPSCCCRSSSAAAGRSSRVGLPARRVWFAPISC
jgi:hypothetical protein